MAKKKAVRKKAAKKEAPVENPPPKVVVDESNAASPRAQRIRPQNPRDYARYLQRIGAVVKDHGKG